MRWSFRGKLLASHLMVVVVVVLVVIVALNRALGAELLERQEARLRAQARGTKEWLTQGQGKHEGPGAGPGAGAGAGSARYARIAGRLGDVVGARVLVTDEAGVLLADSGEGAPGELYWIAEPIGDGLIVRLGLPQAELRATLDAMRNRILLAALVGLAVAALLALLAARVAARPLRAMTESATRIAAGDYRLARAPQLPTTNDEFGVLAKALESLAAQLEARISELTRSEAARREFLANASHELRTPVTAIRGYAETLAAGGGDEATRRQFVETIHRHADRIGRLVDDMLALSALEARPSSALAHEPVPLAPLSRQVEATLRAKAEARGVAIVHEVPDDVVALADPEGAERVLTNLVDNAVKYGKEGGRVRVVARKAGGRVVLEVHDEGPGIAAEHLPRLFDRFYRVDAGRSRAAGGTGLGLAIVKELVDKMGGAVEVTSAAGRGSCFTVELPAAP